MPFFFEAAILSRIRSPVTSRSNWAKDNSTLRVSRPHRAGGIELLGHRDERSALGVKDLDQPGKIGERAGQPVDLVDDDDIDPAALDVGEQALQCRPLHIAAREPAIVVVGPGRYPALVTLAADVGLAGFALCLER